MSKLTTDDAQTGLEAVVGPLQLQLMVHLRVDVLQRRQSRTSRVTVVPAHQRQPTHEQVLTDLEEETGATEDKPASFHHNRIGHLRVTSSSTAEAASLSASLVRQGKALRTVSTEMSRSQTDLSRRCFLFSQGQRSETALTLRVGVPPASEVAHHLAAGQVTVEVLETVQKEVHVWSE